MTWSFWSWGTSFRCMLQRTQSLWFAIKISTARNLKGSFFWTFFRRKPQAKLRGRDTNPHLLLAKAYTLTVLSDIGAFPRPGANGRLTARQGLSATRVQWCYNKSRSVSVPSQYIDVKLALTVGQQPICFIMFFFSGIPFKWRYDDIAPVRITKFHFQKQGSQAYCGYLSQ